MILRVRSRLPIGALACICSMLAVALATGACAPRPAIHEIIGESMGTTWSVRYVATAKRDLLARIQAELDTVTAQMSTWEPTSAISRFNAAPAGSAHALPAGFRTVLEAALALARDTGGAYDPTVGPLVNLWGFGPDGQRTEPPPQGDIDAVRGRIGYQRIAFDGEGRLRQPGGVYLDLSSIAKGYAVDRMAAAVEAAGITDYLVEAGGELRARGHRDDGRRWRVAIERPDAQGLAIQDVVELADMAIATSGDYRAYFESGGRRYSHTIDPRTGAPVEHALVSVTVLDRACMRADALATALTVLGPDAGAAFAKAHGIAALFVEDRDGRLVEHTTPAWDALASAR
jgi:thiamine biosynthesis lipoprotein